MCSDSYCGSNLPLMANDIEHLFRGLFTICSLFGEVSVHVFPHFVIGLFAFSPLLSFEIPILCQMCALQIFSQVCSFTFSSRDKISQEQHFIF